MISRFFIILWLLSPLSQAAEKAPPHMDLEMTGGEYQRLFAKMKIKDAGELQPVINLGIRNLNWLKHINNLRDADHRLSFTSAATQRGIPIDRPSKYNPSIVLQTYNELLNTMPPEMKIVLLGSQDFPDNPPIEEASYLDWGLKIDRAYSIATRWITMQPYLSYLESRKAQDIRGYYFLSREPDLQNTLNHWNTLDQATRDRLQPLLLGLCRNGNGESFCSTTFSQAVRENTLGNFYNRHFETGKVTYDSFFSLDILRDDSLWSASPESFTIPFLNPETPAIHDYLLNIEDEWKWADWHLHLNFLDSTADIPHIVFVAGATPHVNGLGGNEITMDANQPLTEYDARWTIRHEFGHVIGFKDCYVEFYDRAEAAIINYQLDIDNLMCSRRGKLQFTHYSELKRVYTSQLLP